MYGCGIWPVNYGLDKKLVKHVLNKDVDIITLREEHSLRELKDYKVTKPELILSSDPALTLPSASADEIDAQLRNAGMSLNGNYVCFCLRRWPGFNERAEVFAKAA